eukprot:2011136-Lingulodinium_polyedra.AAC.1
MLTRAAYPGGISETNMESTRASLTPKTPATNTRPFPGDPLTHYGEYSKNALAILVGGNMAFAATRKFQK